MNPKFLCSAARLSDETLVARVKTLAARERVATAALVAHLAELDARRLYLAEGCSSLFTYCVQVLHLSEHAAYGRIEAARAARRFPVVLDSFGSLGSGERGSVREAHTAYGLLPILVFRHRDLPRTRSGPSLPRERGPLPTRGERTRGFATLELPPYSPHARLGVDVGP